MSMKNGVSISHIDGIESPSQPKQSVDIDGVRCGVAHTVQLLAELLNLYVLTHFPLQ
jgi:hypothetical protein